MVDTIDLIFSYIDQSLTILYWSIPVLIVLALLVFKIFLKKYPINAIIIEKRGNNLVSTNDRAGKYEDKYSGLTGYRLHKAKDTLPVINYDWVLVNVFKPTNLLEWIIKKLRDEVGTLFLFKYGAKQYKPVLVKKNGQAKTFLKEIKDKNGQVVLMKVYEQFDPRNHLGTLDFEVIDWDNMNFMVQEQRASFERRQKKKDFWRQIVIPLAIMACATIVSIIMIKYAYDLAMSKGTGVLPSDVKPVSDNTPSPNIPIVSDMIPPAS
jgi:hypothetical protein